MRIFAIRDESIDTRKNLAFLFYFRKENCFYIEIPKGVSSWELPLILSSFAEKGISTVDSHWSLVWVQNRIVPPERQNIGEILKLNGLDEYDEFKLLKLCRGRCAQDDCYLKEIKFEKLPNEIKERFEKKVIAVVPTCDNKLLVFFKNETVKKFDMNKYIQQNPQFAVVGKNKEIFDSAKIQPGGYGIMWDINLQVPDSVLYKYGKPVPLCYSDFINFLQTQTVTASEATGILGCTKQNLQLIYDAGKIKPVKKNKSCYAAA
ncbi:MAG: DUF2442 domain-containing protein [Clostridiales bacterium]|nr:DUF2442 domain-containing protein [Clostridiales bacterium]